MNKRDWDFIIGSLGDPLVDIKDWMVPPHPRCLVDAGVYDGKPMTKEQGRLINEITISESSNRRHQS